MLETERRPPSTGGQPYGDVGWVSMYTVAYLAGAPQNQRRTEGVLYMSRLHNLSIQYDRTFTHTRCDRTHKKAYAYTYIAELLLVVAKV